MLIKQKPPNNRISGVVPEHIRHFGSWDTKADMATILLSTSTPVRAVDKVRLSGLLRVPSGSPVRGKITLQKNDTKS